MTKADEIEELYRRHVPDAVRLGFLLTGDTATAQDLAHDAFLSAATKIRSMRDPSRFGAYLRTSVVRASLMRARSRAREDSRVERSQRGWRSAEPPANAGATDRLLLIEALRDLPERQRAAVVLRYWHDLPEREIARTLGCAPGTVKSLLSRGLTALREAVPSEV